MSISITCEKCQTPYSVPDALAGKRAKCKSCGAVLAIPEIVDSAALTPLPSAEGLTPLSGEGDLLTSLSSSPSSKPLLTPLSSSADPDLFGSTNSDPVFSTATAPSPLAAVPRQEQSGLSMLSMVVPPLFCFFLTIFSFVFFLCFGGILPAFFVTFAGVIAGVLALIASLNQRAKLAWMALGGLVICNMVTGVGCLVIGLLLYSALQSAHTAAQAARAKQNNGPSGPPVVSAPSRPTPLPATPVANKYEWPLTRERPPWKKPKSEQTTDTAASDEERLPPGPRKLATAKIKLVDWRVQPDPTPENLMVGPGKELVITLPPNVRSSQIYLPEGYGNAVAIGDTFGQEFEIWDLRNRRKLNRFKHGGIMMSVALSPDGLYIASIRQVEKDRWALCFWSTLTGEQTGDVALNYDSRLAVAKVGFAGPSTAYLARNRYSENMDQVETTETTLWDPATGATRGTLPTTATKVRINNLVSSPSGRYLFLCGESIHAWDTTTLESVGTFVLPKHWHCDGLSFPTTGDQLAMLLVDDQRASHFGVWNLESRAFTLTHDDDKDSSTGNGWTGSAEIAWLEENQGWLARVHQRNANTGAVSAQFSRPVVREQSRKVFDSNMLLTGEALGSNYKTLRLDKFDPARLKPARIGSSDFRVYGDGFNDYAEDDRHRNAGAVPFPYEELLAADPTTWKQHWQYCAGLGRPTVGLRWGLGVQLDVAARNAQNSLEPQMADRDSLRWLEREAGPIGLQIVDLLRKRAQAGQWGKFVDLPDTRLREVIILGGGTRNQLNNSARLASVDIAAVIRIEAGKGRDKDAQLTVEIVDMAGLKKLWESKAISSTKVAQMIALGQDPLRDISAEIGKFIDEKIVLTALSTMPRAEIATRAASHPLHRCNSMAALAELMLYDYHKAAPKEVLLPAYTKLVGKEQDATVLAGEDAAARKALVEKYTNEW